MLPLTVYFIVPKQVILKSFNNLHKHLSRVHYTMYVYNNNDRIKYKILNRIERRVFPRTSICTFDRLKVVHLVIMLRNMYYTKVFTIVLINCRRYYLIDQSI